MCIRDSLYATGSTEAGKSRLVGINNIYLAKVGWRPRGAHSSERIDGLAWREQEHPLFSFDLDVEIMTTIAVIMQRRDDALSAEPQADGLDLFAIAVFRRFEIVAQRRQLRDSWIERVSLISKRPLWNLLLQTCRRPERGALHCGCANAKRPAVSNLR